MLIDADIFKDQRPLLDVRAPIEFNQGAFPNAHNIPILDDLQRELVGICYKEHGSNAATELGHQLVKGKAKEELIRRWTSFIAANPNTLLYCFRGGQRSQIAQDWLAEAGIDVPKITGGYKALRTFLLQALEDLPEITLISGRTGVGKTILLNESNQCLDLEGLANHRGSAFGSQYSPQPTQINFENQIAICLLNLGRKIYLEDEGRLIGKLCLPLALKEKMKVSPIILLEDTTENRVQRIYDEYVLDQLKDYEDSPIANLHAKYAKAVQAISKRLGGERYKLISGLLEGAFKAHMAGDSEQHKNWIEALLKEYYDPMYDYQLSKKQGRIIAKGNHQALKRLFDNETIDKPA